MPLYKFFNSVKFSPNPWTPRYNMYYNLFPSRLPYISPKEIELLNRHMCRLCLLFPTIGVDNILKILALHHYKLPESIDTLLYIKSLQNNHRKEKNFFYKNTCARCSPIQKKSLIDNVLERRAKEEERAILPNITFGPDCTKMCYEHELNFSQITLTQNSTVVNVGNKDNTNAEVEVVDTVPNTEGNCGCNVCLYKRTYTRITRKRKNEKFGPCTY